MLEDLQVVSYNHIYVARTNEDLSPYIRNVCEFSVTNYCMPTRWLTGPLQKILPPGSNLWLRHWMWGMELFDSPWGGTSPCRVPVWPAVVAAFTGLEPPQMFVCGDTLKTWQQPHTIPVWQQPHTIPDLKAAIKAAIRAIPREECGRVIENFARRIQMCLQRRGAHLEHIFERQWNKEFL